MKTLMILTMCLFMISGIGYAETNVKTEFNKLLQQEAYEQLEPLLQEWLSTSPDDPEVYIGYFNFYFNKARTERVVLSKEENPQHPGFPFAKKDTGQVEGYLSSEITYNQDDITKGLHYIDRGLQKFPTRLDMHLGKLTVLMATERYADVKDCLIDLLAFSKRIENTWLWSGDTELQENPQDFLLSNIQNRVFQLYHHDHEETDRIIIEVSHTMIKHYPNAIFGYNNLAAIYDQNGEYEKALDMLLHAEKTSKDDALVLINIAECYLKMDHTTQAIEYFEKVKQVGTASEQAYAERKLQEMSQ